MFNFNQTYYNRSVRNLVIAFGALFESVYITRSNSNNTILETIRVPLTYGGKEKFLLKLAQENSLSKNTKVQLTLPRMWFELGNIAYDPTRKLNRLIERSATIDGVFKSSFAEAPYNIEFVLYAFTRNMDDMLQIIEQILPYFTPEYNVTVKMNDLHQNVDIPIVLNNTSVNENFEGDFEQRRVLVSTFKFTAKTFIYPFICGSTAGIIERSDVNLYDDPGSTANDYYVGDIGYTGDVITGSISEVFGEWP